MITKSKKKKYLIGSAIVVVAVLVLLAIFKDKGQAARKVATEHVKKRTLIETVSANGKIQPEVDVKISPYISGEVVELYVKEGDKVAKGDLLAKIDPEIYISNYERIEASLQMSKANLSNSKARLAQAQAQFARAEEDFKRSEQLFEQNVISQADFDAATSAFKVARAEVTAAEENVKAAEFSVSSNQASLKEGLENLTRTAIYAPNDGTVSSLSVEKGERVTGASQFSAGTEIMRIADLERMIVKVEVNENDIVRVNLHDTSIIEVDAYLDHKFKGIVTEMATSASVTGVSADQVTNFGVKILILKESYHDLVDQENSIPSPFRPGMSATVDIQTETRFDILTVPIQAVTTRADSANIDNEIATDEETDRVDDSTKEFREVVFVYDEGIARMQEVKTGIQDNMYIQILEGLEENGEVIVAPYRDVSKRLKDGDKVNKVDKKDLFDKE